MKRTKIVAMCLLGVGLLFACRLRGPRPDFEATTTAAAPVTVTANSDWGAMNQAAWSLGGRLLAVAPRRGICLEDAETFEEVDWLHLDQMTQCSVGGKCLTGCCCGADGTCSEGRFEALWG